VNRVLWTLQGLLAALFVFAGVTKLAMPLEELVAQSGLPGPLLLFIGVTETLGGLGLILPGLLRVQRGLTPLAAAGLTLIMVGATILTAAGVGGGDAVLALIPCVVGLLTASVAYGRRAWAGRPAPAQMAVAER
jgi:uncharacterized membrane protein YphA (DoxX/SURF4 family)